MAGVGHNSGDVLNQTAQGQLKSGIERIERLLQEKAEIAEQVKEVLAEMKGNGFDTKVLRKVIRLRAMDRAKRAEEAALVSLYANAVGEALGADEEDFADLL